MKSRNPKTKSPIVAAILSFIIPGLGQAYKRELGLGLLMFLAWLGVDAIILFFIGPGTPISLLSLFVNCLSAWDAYTGKISAYAYLPEKKEESGGGDGPRVRVILNDGPGGGQTRIISHTPEPAEPPKPEPAPAENRDKQLARALWHMARKSGYYRVSKITDGMAARYPEKPVWLNTKWVGRALGRLGFKEKRRMSGGVEVLLNEEKVEQVARKQGVITGGY